MTTVTKAVATIEASNDAGLGGFTAILSTGSLDRDGDRLRPDEWVTPLPDRITLDMDHGMTVADTIGSARPYLDDNGRLMIDATFASTPKAQEVRSLINEGHISTVSVAFMNDKKALKEGKPHRELLNAGVVAIPSNRDAVILESKSMDMATFKAALAALFDSDDAVTAVTKAAGGDAAMVQAVHDASTHLGAICATPDLDESGAADGANKAAALQLRLKALQR